MQPGQTCAVEKSENPIDRAFDDATDDRGDVDGRQQSRSPGALDTAAVAPTTPTIPAAPRDGGGGDPGPEDRE